MAPSTPRAPSLSRGPLRRQSSEIRTGCAKKRPSGSVRGVPRKWYPYRDQQSTAVIALPECPENKIKECGQWQATNNRHQTCDDGMPLYATPHEIKDGAD